MKVSVDGGPYSASQGFSIGGHGTATVRLQLVLDPSAVSTAEQLYGWYYFNPNVDGNLAFRRLGNGGEHFHVPWHVSGLAASETGVSATSLDLTNGAKPLAVTEHGAGRSAADLFLLGARSPKTSGGEEDIALIGARSFTGPTVNGVASGVPNGGDALAGLTWREFLTASDEPTEPVEFSVRTYGSRSTVDSQEIDVLVDVGADGVFSDPDIGADTILVKFTGGAESFGGFVCQFDLPSTFDACDREYFIDDSAYNSSVTGIVVDARALGLSNAVHTLSYSVIVCNVSNFDGESLCDFAGGFSNATGTYRPTLDVTHPALDLSRWSCRGFWGNRSACGASAPVTVGVGRRLRGTTPRSWRCSRTTPPVKRRWSRPQRRAAGSASGGAIPRPRRAAVSGDFRVHGEVLGRLPAGEGEVAADAQLATAVRHGAHVVGGAGVPREEVAVEVVGGKTPALHVSVVRVAVADLSGSGVLEDEVTPT